MQSVLYLGEQTTKILLSEGINKPSPTTVSRDQGAFSWNANDQIYSQVFDGDLVLSISYDADELLLGLKITSYQMPSSAGDIYNLATGKFREVRRENLNAMAEYMLGILFDY